METPQTRVAAILREQSSEKFRFKIGGTTLALPHFGRLSSDLMTQVKSKSEDERMWWLLEHVLTEAELELMDTLRLDEFVNIVERWQVHGGVRLGEVLGLLQALEEHTGALEHDLRARLHIDGVRDLLSDRYSWRERVQVYWALTAQMDTLVKASTEGWDRPWSQTSQILVDMWNLLLTANSKKKPSPNAYYPSPVGRKRQGSKAKTLAQARARMARLIKQQPGLENPKGEN